MYTDLEIYNPKDLSKRAFISCYINGSRHRFYNGNTLGINCYPNKSSTLETRERLLVQLRREFTKALVKGWLPDNEKPKVEKRSLLQLLEVIFDGMKGGKYSDFYMRDTRNIIDELKAFLLSENRSHVKPVDFKSSDIERFMLRYSTSGTYHRSKRSTLSPLFTKLVKQGYCTDNPVIQTTRHKTVEVLHEAYKPEQLPVVLAYLTEHAPNLYLCALLMYGTMLRPHKEIRLLKRRHLDSELSRYTLDGKENKGKRIRSLPLTDFVRAELISRGVDQLNPEDYIFTGKEKPFNPDYFKTQWSRAKTKMLAEGIVTQRQTLYSFRHTASINVFERTQNLKTLQELLAHAKMSTSMVYLRSIGATQLDISVMPSLD